MENKNRNKIIVFLLTAFLIIGFIYRINGLWTNYSFWIDEASSATFARAVLERGVPILPSGYAAGDYLAHFYLMAISFNFFGLNEFAARFPSVIFGTLSIILVYFLGKKFFDFRTGLIAAVLTTFSVLEIVYSRQARSYQTLQFFYLLSTLAFFSFLDSWERVQLKLSNLIFFCVSLILLFLTHKFGLLFLLGALFYLVFFRTTLFAKSLSSLGSFLGKKTTYKFGSFILFTFLLFVLAKYFNFYKALQETTTEFWAKKFGFSTEQYWDIVFSHAKYYHSFFWRQYPHVTFLAFAGLIIGLVKNWRLTSLFLSIFLVHFTFVLTRVYPQFVRYVYLIFPFFLILTAYSLTSISNALFGQKSKTKSNLILALLTIFILVNGNKFYLFPKGYYSLNLDMVEIPEPDFKSIYNQVLIKSNFELDSVAVLDNRTDAAEWYLGEGKPDYYIVGPDELEPSYNLQKGILKDPVSGALYLNTLSGLKEIVKENPKGFVVFEERALEYVKVDTEIIDFVHNNLKEELKIKHLAGNSLSIWPIELYSWGMN